MGWGCVGGGGQLGAGSHLCIKNEHVALLVKPCSCFPSSDVILMTSCFRTYLGFIYARVKSNALWIRDVFDTVDLSFWIVILGRALTLRGKVPLPARRGPAEHRSQLEVHPDCERTCFRLENGLTREAFYLFGISSGLSREMGFLPNYVSFIL